MKFYHLLLVDPETGKTTIGRRFRLWFSGDGKTKGGPEEYGFSVTAREMYRDAAHLQGKWPLPVSETEAKLSAAELLLPPGYKIVREDA